MDSTRTKTSQATDDPPAVRPADAAGGGAQCDNAPDKSGEARDEAKDPTVVRLRRRLSALQAEHDRLQRGLSLLLSAREWRLLQVLRRVREKLAPYGTRRARWFWRIADTLLRRPAYLRGQAGPYVTAREGRSPRESMAEILAAHPDRRGVVVHPSIVDWGWMKQRPHHLMLQFARAGYIVFFCPPQTRSDLVPQFDAVAERLYLCANIEWLYELPRPLVFVTKPQDLPLVERFRDPRVIYDVLDDLAVHSPTGRATERDRAQHHALLRKAAVVCATATHLLEEARAVRDDVLLCPNAVDFDHFHLEHEPPAPPDLAARCDGARPIIGYCGALAPWFDFRLLFEAARRRPDYDFILIGPDYEDAWRQHAPSAPPNIHWLGEKRFDDLPEYYAGFGVATIPFRVNEITRATSPIKLFEYMAAGKPIVTTPLPECERQPQVLIGDTPELFAARLDEALALSRDRAFCAALVATARDNDWSARFAALEARLQSVDS